MQADSLSCFTRLLSDYFIIGVVTLAGLVFHAWLFVRFGRWADRDLALALAGEDPKKHEWSLQRLATACSGETRSGEKARPASLVGKGAGGIQRELMQKSAVVFDALLIEVSESGRQTLTLPGAGDAAIVQTVMQTAWAPLPELYTLRQQAVPSPMRRAVRLLVQKTLFGFG